MVTATAIRDRAWLLGRLLLPLGLGCGLLAAPVAAGEWTLTPSVSVKETWTDNVGLTARNEQSDLITDIAPGLRIQGKGDRFKLNFDYQIHQLLYAHDSRRNDTQNALNALGSLELVEDFFFIDGTAMISQQNVSAFNGANTTAINTNDNNNSTETATYRLSPYIQGRLANFADYQLRYNASRTRTEARNSFDTDSRDWSARLAGTTGYSALIWSLDASTQEVDFSNGRSNEAERLRGVLTYHFDPQFRVSLIGGREANDYLSFKKESHTLKGFGFEWAPTERTLVGATHEKRFFGDNNLFNFSHRTAGTAWKFSQSKDVTTSPTQQADLALGTYYDLFYNMLASTIPDPVARAAAVNAILQSNGLSPTAPLQGGFLTSGVILQKRREMSFALNGVRNTVTFAATQSESESLSKGSGLGVLIGTDFANVDRIRQRGLSVNWSHRLGELSSLSGGISRLDSKGRGATSPETRQKLFTVNFTTKLGPKTSAVLGVRRTSIDGTTEYTENAVSGSLTHQF